MKRQLFFDMYSKQRLSKLHRYRAVMYEFAAQHDKFICTDVPVKNGRIELIHYIKEQSVSFEYHRYGSFSEVPPVE